MFDAADWGNDPANATVGTAGASKCKISANVIVRTIGNSTDNPMALQDENARNLRKLPVVSSTMHRKLSNVLWLSQSGERWRAMNAEQVQVIDNQNRWISY